jgi:peptide/nickel transport system permease protein
MKQYLARRILQMIPILIGVSLIIFLVFNLAPGDFIDATAPPTMSAERKMELKQLYGLDKPMVQRYFIWASNAVRGNFGESFAYKAPVSTVIGDYVWNSFTLSMTSFVLSVLIAIPIGVVSATKQYSLFDGVFTVFALIGLSLPSFFFGLLLVKFLAIDLRLLPVAGMTSAGFKGTPLQETMDIVKHLVLPCTVLTMMHLGSLMRYTRTSVLEVIRQDYIRTARAKGLKEKVVIYKHALRNALIPIVTVLGLSLPSLFGGAIIIETIFVWPGIGKIALGALTERDYPFLMGFNMFMAILTLLGNLIADVSYALVDPRIRLK